MTSTDSLTPLVQPLKEDGFVALSAILLIVIVGGGGWVIKKLLDVLSHNSEVISGCMKALEKNNELTVKALEVQGQVLERITAIDTRCEERCNREGK